MRPGAGAMLAMLAVSCCRLAAGAGGLLEQWLQGQDSGGVTGAVPSVRHGASSKVIFMPVF